MGNPFQLKLNESNVLIEMFAGFTTFFAIAYIIILNPSMLAKTGMDFGEMVVGKTIWIQIISSIAVIFAFLIVDTFDTMETIFSVGKVSRHLNQAGKLPNSIVAAGLVLGTVVTTTWAESVAGIRERGKTGLTSVVVAILFIVPPLFVPIAKIVPYVATVPALIIIGVVRMGTLKKINCSDLKEATHVFVTLITMPFTVSITDGIAFGFLHMQYAKRQRGKHTKLTELCGVSSLFSLCSIVVLR